METRAIVPRSNTSARVRNGSAGGAIRRRQRASRLRKSVVWCAQSTPRAALAAGLVSAVIGEQLPGHGTVYLGQTLKFLAPVRPGDTVLAEVTVTGIDIAKRRVTLDCRCSVDGRPVLAGEAKVLAPSRKFD